MVGHLHWSLYFNVFQENFIFIFMFPDMYKRASIAPDHNHGGRNKIGVEKEIYMFIWYISNTITFRQLGILFGVTKSSAWIVIGRVSSWLVSISHEHIKWPNQEDIVSVSNGFERMKGIPGIIGAIDGCLIKIKAPKTNKEVYFNRKKFYSLGLQAVDSKKKFIDLHCGEPGSLHDSRVLRRSSIFRKALENENAVFPNNTFIIGDSAYPSLNWLVTPFKDNGNLTDREKNLI